MTASITMMPEITRAVGTPRALHVPFGLGCPFGSPGDRQTQMGVLRSLLALCGREDVPVLESLN
ncbi:MAG: hypothetical protein ACRD26_15580 [Vicinamibacterales bacterium]